MNDVNEPLGIEEYRVKVLQLEAQVSLLKDMLREASTASTIDASGGNTAASTDSDAVFGAMTLKQNAALQLLLKGLSNSQIARCFDASPSTSKVHVRGIMDKLGVHTRAKVIIKVKKLFDDVDEGVYMGLTGMPKDWGDDCDKYPDVTDAVRLKTR